ncbi:hypothetical protein KP001_01630 [Geomonas subterranea]|uniref:Uncharacterized protein n=2 Tax=Geomonas subterranea TaxID=2847989 RepID=A0ABX8LLS0_9BACT|nr:hypothetical protein [Geomonas subterranea]QXE91269.1 hypothetical protein KP001_01630 [Geomonas subterranea]
MNESNPSDSDVNITHFEKAPLKYIAHNFGMLTGLITICSYMFERSYLETLKIESVCPPFSFVDYFNNTLIWLPLLLGPMFLGIIILCVILLIRYFINKIGSGAVVVRYAIYLIILIGSVLLSAIYIKQPYHGATDAPWGLGGLCSFVLMVVYKLKDSKKNNYVYLMSFALLLGTMIFSFFGQQRANEDVSKPKNIGFVTMKYNQKPIYCNVLRVYEKFAIINFPPSKTIQVIRTDEMGIIERMK